MIRRQRIGPDTADTVGAAVGPALIDLFSGVVQDEHVEARVAAVTTALEELLSTPDLIPDPVELIVEWHPERADEHAPWLRILIAQRPAEDDADEAPGA